MFKTKDEIIKEYLAKRISPILDAKDWKRNSHELVDLAAYARLYKVYLIIENAIELEQAYCDEVKTPRGRATGHLKTKNQKLTAYCYDTQYNVL